MSCQVSEIWNWWWNRTVITKLFAMCWVYDLICKSYLMKRYNFRFSVVKCCRWWKFVEVYVGSRLNCHCLTVSIRWSCSPSLQFILVRAYYWPIHVYGMKWSINRPLLILFFYLISFLLLIEPEIIRVRMKTVFANHLLAGWVSTYCP